MGDELSPEKFSIPRWGIEGILPEGSPETKTPESTTTGYGYLRQFLKRDVCIQALLEMHADPETIRVVAHAALNQVLDEVKPSWEENRSHVLDQI